ncbi:MAG: DNA-directed RNA polymerase subunit alpha [Clostridia bacterium]|nr:DNA-directed RNA polymerase subunit alpha [Clostridia bacterium]
MMEIDKPNMHTEESADGAVCKLVVEPLERGFGITLGNALRRVLLASLPGAAVVGIKIEGVQHEFSVIPGVKEDVTEIILNLKNLALKTATTDCSFRKVINIKKQGPCVIFARDIETDAEVEVLNPDLYICTLDEGAVFEAELHVGRGRGYVTADKNKEVNKDLKLSYPIGYIPIDSIFTPVKKASYNVENARVGQNIDFDKLTLDVTTNGAFSAVEIVSLAAKVLQDHIKMFVDLSELGKNIDILKSREEDKQQKVLDMSIDEMDLSVRSQNCLNRAGIKTVADLIQRTEEDMLKVRNLGRKSLDEVLGKIKSYGLQLKEKDE